MEAIMKTEFEPGLAGDAVLSEGEDAAIAAWTLDDLDPAELGSARRATGSDEQGG
jgi:hypothetical protein